MIVPERFHYINYPICFLLGVPLNALLVWLIMNRSADEMRPYRPVLLLSTMIDIVYLTNLLVVMPVFVVKDGIAAMLSLGPFGSLPQPWGFAVLMTWAFFFSISQFSLAVPFVYRYYVICRQKIWGLREFRIMLLVPVALSFEHIYLLYDAGYASEKEQQAGNNHFGFPTDSNKTYVMPFFTPIPARVNLSCSNIAILTIINYILVVIYGRRLYRYLNAMAGDHLSQQRARALNKQISTALILQAVTPLIVEFLPFMELIIAILSGVNFGESSLYMLGISAWVPVMNPLVSIWVVKAYRRQVLAWIGCRCLNHRDSSVPMQRMRGEPKADPQIAITPIAA